MFDHMHKADEWMIGFRYAYTARLRRHAFLHQLRRYVFVLHIYWFINVSADKIDFYIALVKNGAKELLLYAISVRRAEKGRHQTRGVIPRHWSPTIAAHLAMVTSEANKTG